MKKIFLSLFILISLFSICAQEQEQSIQWNPVEGASGYKIEIRKDNVLIIENTIKGTSFPAKLNPGDYQYRISVINKFGKVSSSSQWVSLNVKARIQPLIVSIDPSKINRSLEKVTLNIKGFGFSEESLFYIDQNETPLPLISMDKEAGIFISEIESARFKDVETAKIKVVNPSGLEYEYSRPLEFYSTPTARIKDLTPDKAIHNYVETNFLLRGENFNSDITFYFVQEDDVLYPDEIEILSSEEIKFWLDVREKKIGSWDLIMEHPEWEKTVKKSNLLKIQRTENEESEYWSYMNNGTFLFTGIPLILNPEKGIESFGGMIIKLDLDLMQDSGIGKYSGLEIKAGANLYNGDDYEYTSMVYSGAYIRSHLPFPVNFIFRGGMGGRWLKGESNKANGPFFQTGFGIMLSSFDPFIFQINTNLEAGLRNTEATVILSPSINGGFHL